MILQNRQNVYRTLIRIIYTTGEWSGFKWFKNVANFDVNSINKKSLVSYILEVDIEYPIKLHELHNDYPLTPEKLSIPYDILSDYCKKLSDTHGIKVCNVKKLIPNLGDKTNYSVHYSNL